ncbi:MAG TPA: XRE family transcriptional regulator [Candidatus Acetothermia bacterium]|nr:XRE family transcriptional regulator [Candidatus Acetothermia bacterium]
MEPIGERLRQFRLQEGLSKRALASQLGVSVPTILRWEKGLSAPNDYNLHKIERLLAQGNVPEPGRRALLLSLFDSLT